MQGDGRILNPLADIDGFRTGGIQLGGLRLALGFLVFVPAVGVRVLRARAPALRPVRLAVGAFILPYIYVANPQLLLIGATPLGIVQAAITATIGMTAIGAGLAGFLVTKLHWIERLALIGAGLCLVGAVYFIFLG